MVRWYVLQVSTGQETGVRDALQGLGIRAAVPREERAIRNGGGWTTKVYTLLPGYVFLALEYSAENYYRVKAIPHVLRFLGPNGLSPSYLTHLEVEWLRLLDNGGEVLKPSRVETLPEGGVGLDIGCGSGALTIACAKRNPQGKMVGIDRWGKEYASFSLPLCEKNAAAEGVKNASFRRGNAVKLDFPNESFDAVTSNYVYHNITGADKQALLLETLRVLKKGGTFAIHDLMSPRRYGDMQAFVQKLRDMGYERVELTDTTDGSFMTPKEAGRLMLRGSTLLTGRK